MLQVHTYISSGVTKNTTTMTHFYPLVLDVLYLTKEKKALTAVKAIQSYRENMIQ